MIAVIGGSKVSTKLTVLKELLNKVDVIIVGGGIANTFLKSSGFVIGQSLFEESMINKANEEAEKNVIKTNQDFHNLMETRKKNAEERIKQIKNQALKDVKNASVKIAIESVEKLVKNSLDKSKLDKIYSSSIEETKLALKKKSS